MATFTLSSNEVRSFFIQEITKKSSFTYENKFQKKKKKTVQLILFHRTNMRLLKIHFK